MTTNDDKPITAADFRRWIETALPGDRFRYHQGNLGGAARLPRVSDLRDAVQKAAGLNTRKLIDTDDERASYFVPGRPRYVDLVQQAGERETSVYWAIMRADHSPRHKEG